MAGKKLRTTGRTTKRRSAATTKKTSRIKRAGNALSWKFRALATLAGLAILTSSIVLPLAFIYYTVKFPDPIALRQRDKPPVVHVLAVDGTPLTDTGQSHDFIPYDLLPRHVIEAVLAIEDRRFFSHQGVDPVGIARAMLANLRAGRYAQGGSTLTQQLAKNLFLSPERSLRRKVEELMLGLWLEARLGKQDILELYLNRVYFGSGAYGIEAAAQRYFEKSARNLSLGEAAVIAGLLKAPSKFSPGSSRALATARGRLVLRRMRAAGFITPVEELKAARNPVRFASLKSKRGPTGYEYAVDFVLERLPPLVGAMPKDVFVETTIDAGVQRKAQAIVAQAMAREGRVSGASQAAVVVLDTRGRIRALVGGRSFARSQYDRASRARRQPGSAFKPLVYLAALERGWKPESVMDDAPVRIGNWRPRNNSGAHEGPMTLRYALAHSVNTVAVRLQREVGADRVIELARRLGIRSELRNDPSLALGTSEVTVLELTNAYAALANAGVGVPAHVIRKVRTSAGAVLYEMPGERRRRLIEPRDVRAMNDMLNAVVTSGTGRRALLERHPAAGKTGTTQDFRDAWFVGYTAQLAAGVWVGNDDARPTRRVTGGGLPARIWHDVMSFAHEGLAPRALPGLEPAPRGRNADVASNARP